MSAFEMAPAKKTTLRLLLDEDREVIGRILTCEGTPAKKKDEKAQPPSVTATVEFYGGAFAIPEVDEAGEQTGNFETNEQTYKARVVPGVDTANFATASALALAIEAAGQEVPKPFLHMHPTEKTNQWLASKGYGVYQAL